MTLNVEVRGLPGYVDRFTGTVVPGAERVPGVDGRGPLTVIMAEFGEIVVAPAKLVRMLLGPRVNESWYVIDDGRVGHAYSWSREINARTFDFTLIQWDGGGTTVRVWEGMSALMLHEWES